jgi:HlyD family secretion protein
VKAAQQQVGILNEQLQQSHIQVEQAEEDARGRVNQAEAQLAQAEAQLAQQEAAYRIAAYDRDVYTQLAQSGSASERQARQAQSNADAQAAVVAAAKRQVEAARGALTSAKSNLANPRIRGSQAAAIQKQIVQQQTDIASSMADAERARAQLREAQANRQDLIMRAPFKGTVITRTAEPGEVVPAGAALVTLLDLQKVYLRGFVPEGQIGKVKVDQPARIYLDSNPSQPIDAYVSRIDPQATFTPENTYFRDDRVKQVVGVKLQLKGGFGFAKPGMPADGEILTSGAQWPPSPIARRRK